MDEATQFTLTRGVRLIEILNQPPYHPLALYYQVVLIYAATRGYLDTVEVRHIAKFKDVLFELIWDEEAGVLNVLKELAGADLNVKSVVYDAIIQTALKSTL